MSERGRESSLVSFQKRFGTESYAGLWPVRVSIPLRAWSRLTKPITAAKAARAAWVKGTFHGVSKKYMPAYLDEWNYRFNCRSLMSNLFQHVLRRATNCGPITYKEIALSPSLMKPLHGLSR
ncbi:MAG: transposase [Desulfarculus sp.]|nr:transposase [Pseudomonadota bacterium]MBU4598014.1 transposase [Pseudomonadota bacterium]MBV1714329.1 transposase [Desulfarculus sp.]MBV1740062.1 transposase [Desulfarculus sp.]